MKNDKIWALSRAAEPMGFTPHARSTIGLLISLECEGLVSSYATIPTWSITDKGREVLEQEK